MRSHVRSCHRGARAWQNGRCPCKRFLKGFAMPVVWLNGKILDQNEAHLSFLDRGFTLADGVFETILARSSGPLWLADHLIRLKVGAECIGLSLPADEKTIEVGVIRVLEAENCQESAVRITLTRGPSARRGLWPPSEPVRPTLLISVAPFSASPPQRLIVARKTRRNEYSPLSRIKSLNYGDNLVARQEAIERGATDAVMLNVKGNLACATTGNLFLRVDRTWVTPPVSEGVLPGLARRRILAMLNAKERAVPESTLPAVEAAFISNSLGCIPVVALEDHQLADSLEGDTKNIYS